MVDAGTPRSAPANHMHGYLSRDGLPPGELLASGRNEVTGYGGEIVAGTALDLTADGPSGFCVLLENGQRISARRLLVTTGLRDELPDIPGLQERWARDVLHCPYCHGYEVRNRQLGVIGGTPGAVRYAQIVRQWSHDLVYFTPPDSLTAGDRAQLVARAIGVIEGTVEQLVIDDDKLRGVQMSDGCVVPRDALFVPPRFVPNNRLLVRLGCDLDADGWVTADATDRTRAPRSRQPGTSPTRAPRSSPPPAPARWPPSRSTLTSSKTTCATLSAITRKASCQHVYQRHGTSTPTTNRTRHEPRKTSPRPP